MGAALDMLKKGKEKKPAPLEDEVGEEYSKVDDDEGDETGEGMPLSDDVHEDGASFDSLADHLSIPEESREGAKAALKSYVKACMRENNSSDK